MEHTYWQRWLEEQRKFSSQPTRPCPWLGEFIPLARTKGELSAADAEVVPGTLCARCLELKILVTKFIATAKLAHGENATTSDFMHHVKTVTELEHSSARGCHLCTIFWQELDDTTHYGVASFQAIQQKKFNFLDTAQEIKVCAYCYRDPSERETLRYQLQIYDRRGEKLTSLSLNPADSRTPEFSHHPRTDSSYWLGMLRSSMTHCIAHHESCRRKITDPSAMPRRLLDLTNVGSAGMVRLVHTQNVAGGNYIAMSYSWGEARVLKLTASTEPALRAGVPCSDFPQTIQDAIMVCLKLGVPFLWVDACCIFQDSISDWEAEAKNVLATYSNSLLTIAATGNTSCDQGLFCVRDPFLYLPCAVAELPGGPIFYANVSFSPILLWHTFAPLHGRGWVVQERLLAPRTINFGVSIVWECREDLKSDCTTKDLYAGQQKQRQQLATLAAERAPATEAVENYQRRLMKEWYKVLSQYTSSTLSHSSDRLAAVSGIMSSFQEHGSLTPWFGLWKPLSIWELMWSLSIAFYNDDSQQRGLGQNTQFPSWSWARHNLEIIYVLLPHQAPYDDVVYAADLSMNKTCQCESHAIGCTNRYIIMSSRIVPISLGDTPGQPSLPCVAAILEDKVEDLSVSVVWQDHTLDRVKTYEFLILVVRHGLKPAWRCGGLLISPVSLNGDRGEQFFERLGFADFQISESQWQRLVDLPERVITLI